jgi:hypothetical protein
VNGQKCSRPRRRISNSQFGLSHFRHVGRRPAIKYRIVEKDVPVRIHNPLGKHPKETVPREKQLHYQAILESNARRELCWREHDTPFMKKSDGNIHATWGTIACSLSLLVQCMQWISKGLGISVLHSRRLPHDWTMGQRQPRVDLSRKLRGTPGSAQLNEFQSLPLNDEC